MMLMAGMGLLAAAVPLPQAGAVPSPRVPPPTAPPDAATGAYIFQDEFDGPPGCGPRSGEVDCAELAGDVFPPVVGHYRDDRRNVFLDGNSNLVLLATQEGDQYFTGKLQGNWRGMINHHLGSANQIRLHDPRPVGPRTGR